MLRHFSRNDRYGKRTVYPQSISSRQGFDAAIDRGALLGLIPEAPFITRETPIVTFGSCFAINIAKDLLAAGYNVHLIDVLERLFTAFSLRDFVLDLASEGDDSARFRDYWGVSAERMADTRAAIVGGAVVICTFGFSFVWIDKEKDEIIFDPSRKDEALRLIVDDPDRFEMRPTDPAENFEAMMDMINAIRRLNPFAKIILTLSPVPVRRVVHDYPVMVADNISKASLVCALHQVTMARLKDVYYFPSYEILRGFASMLDVIWFEDNLLAHVQKRWIDYTMSKFKAAYCAGEQAIAPPLPHLP